MNNNVEVLAAAMPAPGDFEDCYAFSIHKSGSTLMNRMIGEVCAAERIPAISIPDVIFQKGTPGKGWDDDPAMPGLISRGRVYYGFRHLPDMLLDPGICLRERKAVLLVRDPRDALVSEYFSYGGRHVSHRAPGKAGEDFIARVKSQADLEIDDYVLRSAQSHLDKLVAYRRHLDFDRVLLRRYEQIYFDKKLFLTEIFEHFGLPVAPAVLERVAERNDIRPATEEAGKHIRKGAPGDHRDKLREDTIQKLDAIFAATCRDFGYDL